MNKKEILTLLMLSLSMLTFGQRTLWTIGTARTVPAGQQEFGILQPLQIGLTPSLELSTQPLLTLATAPNFTLKKRWTSNRWLIASQHTYVMPTLLVRTLQESKWKNLIPDTLKIPYLFTFRNEGLVSRRIGREMMITGSLGFEFTLKTSGDSLPMFNYPALYMHSSTFNKRMLWFTGIKLDGNIYRNYNFMMDLDFISSGWNIKNWAVEHRGYFIWNKSVHFAALVGYKLGYGNYPTDRHFFILPIADLIWKINLQPPEPEKDLFRK